MNGTLLLRIAVAIILLTHSVFGMFNNGINDFGNLYLNQIGFAPFGVFLAWSIKLSSVPENYLDRSLSDHFWPASYLCL